MTGRRENIFRNVASGVSSVAEAMRQLRELHSAELGDTDPAEVAATATANGCVVVRRELLQWLTRGFSAVTGFGLEAIDANESFDRYGIDSIAVVKLNVVFAERFPNLAKTVLYEYPSLNELCDFLLEQESVSPRSLSVGAESAAAAPQDQCEKIAIIGLSGRFGSAENTDEFWELLRSGCETIGEVPAERWSLDGFYESDIETAVREGKSYSKWGGFLKGFAEFDPLFFGIAPKEAANIDPQERLFLQCAHDTLEDAGYAKKLIARKYRGRVGVYAGVTKTGFELHGRALRRGAERSSPRTSFSSVANRVSYLFDLHGPSMPIDTMCSASLTAIHEACQHLLRNECELAIAGGVNLYLHRSGYSGLCAQRMLAHGDECRSFGADATGFVAGEGVGAVLLKPLDRAIADRDHIYGVILGTSINHGGRTSGYTVPNPNSQSDLIEAALNRSQVNARTISYLEAHGTGTELGDPIEIAGLTKAFRRHTPDSQYCAIGSVKSNIGHLEAAAGIASLTKVLLQMKERQLVPSLHAEVPNPNIDFAHTPFEVQRVLSEWRRPIIEQDGRMVEYPRRAGISAFGAGGANAHIIVEEYPAPAFTAGASYSKSERPALIILSARSDEQLHARAQRLVEYMDYHDYRDSELRSIAYTLQTGRDEMGHRLALTAHNARELKHKLRLYLAGGVVAAAGCFTGVTKEKAARLPAASDDDSQRTAAAYVADGRYEQLLRQWVNGSSFDWDTLYGAGANTLGDIPARIPLPTYPFAKERFWIESSGRVDDADKLPDVAEQATNVSSNMIGTHCLVPHWSLEPSTSLRTPRTAFAVSSERPLVFGGSDLAKADIEKRYPLAQFAAVMPGDELPGIVEQIKSAQPFDHVIWIAPQTHSADDEILIGAQQYGVLHGFRLIKALLACGYASRPLAWTVITFRTQSVYRGDELASAHAGIHGLIGSLAKEYVHWSIRALDLQSDADWTSSGWSGVAANARARTLALREGRWHRMHLLPVRGRAKSDASPYQDNKVYVVVGGAGHVGAAWTEWVVRRSRAQVIWLGRRNKDGAIRAKIDRIAQFGMAPQYLVADAADPKSLQEAYAEIKRTHSEVHGLVMASIVLEPRALQEMDEAHFRVALRAKIDASVRTVAAFGHDPLDFILFFSSAISLIKNPLQSHYASGCAFADAFARQLRSRWDAGGPDVKVMNWGFWNMPANAGLEHYAQLIEQGVGALEVEEALTALDTLLMESIEQMAAIKVTKPLLLEGMSHENALSLYPKQFPVKIDKVLARLHGACIAASGS